MPPNINSHRATIDDQCAPIVVELNLLGGRSVYEMQDLAIVTYVDRAGLMTIVLLWYLLLLLLRLLRLLRLLQSGMLW